VSDRPALAAPVAPQPLRPIEFTPAPPPPVDLAVQALRQANIPLLASLPAPTRLCIGDAPISPAAWSYDWSRGSPLNSPPVLAWLRRKCSGIVLPAAWFGAYHFDGPLVPSTWELNEGVTSEALALDSAFAHLAQGSRAVSTLAQYKNPFLKLALWVALRGGRVDPPDRTNVARYLTVLVVTRRNQSAAEVAVRSLQYVCWLNGWNSLSSAPCCQIPMEAAKRAFAGPTKKASPLEAWMVVAIVRASIDGSLWKRMYAWSILAAFMCLGRYSDLCRLRFDSGYFEVHAWGIRFFLDKRKPDQQYKGQWIDVARNEMAAVAFDGFSAVDELLAARVALGSVGPILRRVIVSPRQGRILAPPFFPPDHLPLKFRGLPMNASRELLQAHLQECLVSQCGLDAATAKRYTTQGIRAGAATTLVKHRIPEQRIKDLAGVTSEDWLVTYDRVDLERRLEGSRGLGL